MSHNQFMLLYAFYVQNPELKRGVSAAKDSLPERGPLLLTGVCPTSLVVELRRGEGSVLSEP